MANLPDLDTSDIGWMAYWNAIDDGEVNSIDPEEVLDAGFIDSYEIYDNGVQGDGSANRHGATIQWRVKNDGWFVAYMVRGEDYSTENDSEVRGYWDISDYWTDNSSTQYILRNNSLETRISDLQSELDNKPEYNAEDVGLYHYEYNEASTATLLHVFAKDSQNKTATFLYTDDTTLEYASVAAGNSDGWAEFETERVASKNEYGSIDILGDGLIPDADTEYEVQVKSTEDLNSDYAALDLLTFWS